MKSVSVGLRVVGNVGDLVGTSVGVLVGYFIVGERVGKYV